VTRVPYPFLLRMAKVQLRERERLSCPTSVTQGFGHLKGVRQGRGRPNLGRASGFSPLGMGAEHPQGARGPWPPGLRPIDRRTPSPTSVTKE